MLWCINFSIDFVKYTCCKIKEFINSIYEISCWYIKITRQYVINEESTLIIESTLYRQVSKSNITFTVY